MLPILSGSKRLHDSLRSGRRAIAVITTILLGGCQQGVLDPQGPVASAQRLILFDSVGIIWRSSCRRSLLPSAWLSGFALRTPARFTGRSGDIPAAWK
jgi:hypothetical protein